jgi:probable HAF family extracellular repeat protein
LYRDDEGKKAYVFFSGTDENTSVKISAKSNISFGNYIGDSLKIETTGSIDGESIILNNPDETGLILKSGIEGEDENLEVLGYDAIHLGAGFAQGINNQGDVIVGGYGASLSFVYSDGEINYLGSDNRITPNGINDLGQVVGSFTNSDNNRHAFLYSNGTISDLGVLPGAETYEIPSESGLVEVPYNFALSNAKAINNSGQIVGVASSKFAWGYDQFRWRAFISDGGSMTDLQSQLNSLFGYEEPIEENDSYWFYASEAYGINDLGQVVGSHVDYEGQEKAFVYGGGQNINLHSLLGDGVENSYARDVNNEGQIIGAFNTSGSTYTAFVYSDGQIKTLGGSLIDINNNGIVLGSSGTTAIVHDINNNTSTNLNVNGIIDSEEAIWLTSARGINDKGQIAATGYFTSDIGRTNNAFLLNPRFAETGLDDYINIGNISTFGDSVVLQGGEINLTGETVTTAGGDVTFDGKTSVKGNSLTIDSAGGDVNFTNTLDGVSGGSQNLTIKTLRGNVLFDKAVGGSAAFNDFTVAGAGTVTARENIAVNGNLKLEVIDNLATANLSATGLVNLSLGKVGEEVFNSTGNVTVGNINAQALSVLNNGSLTAGNIQTTDGDIEIISLNNLTLGQLTATNGAIDLISGVGGINLTEAATSDNLFIALAKQAIFTKNLTSHNEAVILKSSTRGVTVNGVIAAYDDVSVAALKNVVVKEITSADGGVSLISATGKITEQGAIVAVEDVTVGAALDITTKNITASLGAVDLVSTQASVTVNGGINSAFDVGISAQNNVTTNKILAYEGAVGIQAIQGGALIRGNINTFNQDVYVIAQNTTNVRNVISKGGDVYLVSRDGLLKTGYLRTDKTKNIGGKVYLEAGNTISVDGSVSIGGKDYSIYTGVTEAGWISVATETKILEGNKTQFEGKDIATAEIYGDLALLTEPREAPTIPNPLPIILEIIRGIIDESRTPNPQNANDINPITGQRYGDDSERNFVASLTSSQKDAVARIVNNSKNRVDLYID